MAYGPAELRAAYATPSTGGDWQTVAVVIAYDHPNAEAGLPPCTTANGCFRKMSQRGDSVLPRADVAWPRRPRSTWTWSRAVCPRCHILLVEAGTSDLATLVVAVAATTTPATLRGHAITAATGDSTALNGTTLTRSSSGRGWNEAVWAGTGGGCSTLFTKPGWRADKGCAKRTVADVSAVADPGTGVAVHHSYGVTGGPWFTAGGTSVATPIAAGLHALFEVISGGNGARGGGYLCTATAGYDGPSGPGTPNGLGAFQTSGARTFP